MGEFTSLISTIIVNQRTKRSIQNIEKSNEMRRNITRYEPSDVEGFIERDAQMKPCIISGGSGYNRARATAAVAVGSLVEQIPVIVLHEGNMDLENQISLTTAFTNNKVILQKNSGVYDPFYNRNDQEVINLISNSAQKGIGSIGQQYLMGITTFIRSKNIPPYYTLFADCPYDELFDKVDDAETKGHLTAPKATQIRGYLLQGQNEKPNVQTFFSQLAYQGVGLLSTTADGNISVNIRTAVTHKGLLMMDIGSSTNEIFLNLVMNEIKEILRSGEKIMLVLDGIHLKANDILLEVAKSNSARCLTTLASEDVYSMLGADDSLFHIFTGNANKCLVFAHTTGVSCNKWSEVFGYYDMDKVSENVGINQNFKWGYGTGVSKIFNVESVREHSIKPDSLVRMSQNEVYILDRGVQELAHVMLK